MSSSPVLLVGPDAEPWASRAEGATVTPASDVESARAYLAGTVFDAVYVQEGVAIAGLRALRDALGLSMPVEPVASFEAFADRLGERGGADEVREALTVLRDEMSRVAHALNNPLSVITGNAQLGQEMGAALGVDDDIRGAFEQIQQAATELGGLFGEITTLRRRIDRLLT